MRTLSIFESRLTAESDNRSYQESLYSAEGLNREIYFRPGCLLHHLIHQGTI